MAEEKSLQDWIAPLTTKEELHDAVEKAFHYRGDVTITLRDGAQVVGYVFDRNANAAEPFVQLFPQDKDAKVRVLYTDIAGLAFTGKDLAAENSWAAYVARTRRGPAADSPAKAP